MKDSARIALIVDEHPVVRAGVVQTLSRIPELVVREADNGADASKILTAERIDLMIVELFLKTGSGLDLVKDVHYRRPKFPIIVFTGQSEDMYAERVLSAGAIGYVEKTGNADKIIDAVEHAFKGEFYFSERILERLRRRAAGLQNPSTSILDALSDRELEIFILYGSGLSMTQIADKLFLGRKTVETHRERIRRKLELSTNTDVVRLAASLQLGKSLEA